MRVKICGLTQAEDAAFVHAQGAWALGFIFTPLSKRCVTADTVLPILHSLPGDCFTVGVFVNQVDECIDIAQTLPLKALQLHGDETPEDCARIRDATNQKIIKALRLKTESDLTQIDAYQNAADFLLIDAAVDGQYGGSGETANWTLAAQAVQQSDIPVILAGGLGIENILTAYKDVTPHAVDLSSSIEDRPGIKNHDKITALFETIQRNAA